MQFSIVSALAVVGTVLLLPSITLAASIYALNVLLALGNVNVVVGGQQ